MRGPKDGSNAKLYLKENALWKIYTKMLQKQNEIYEGSD